MSRSTSFRILSAVVVALTSATGAVAIDGVLEINQTCAINTGCFPGDTAGFPVTVSASGSYLLTSVLTLPDENTTGIAIDADRVTLDLNGFGIEGPVTCSGTTGAVVCSAIGAGFGVRARVLPAVLALDVGNGYVSGVGSVGLRLNDYSIARNLRIENCGRDGILAGKGTLVLDSTIRGVGQRGVAVSTSGGPVSLRGSSIGVAGSGTIAPEVRETGGNECDDEQCSFPRKRFYLSQTTVQGNTALTGCAAGFHMASMWEIFDPSTLVYDKALGEGGGDAGEGPPTDHLGWIRTGWVAVDSAIAGEGNCKAWSDTTGFGSIAAPHPNWESGAPDDIPPWNTDLAACLSNIRVWCIQD